MDYYLRPWEECRGDDHADWGPSHWYFEVDDAGNVLRQVEAYESGMVLKYYEAHPHDEYGGLAAHPLDREEFAPFAISAEEFHDRWIFPVGPLLKFFPQDGRASWRLP